MHVTVPDLVVVGAALLLVVVLVLLRRLRGTMGKPVRRLEDLLGQVRSSAMGLSDRVEQLEQRTPGRSPLHGLTTRRLGAIEAIAESVVRDLKRGLAAGEPSLLAAAAARAADRAHRLAQLAAGGRARDEQATLPGLWPRVLGVLGQRIEQVTVRTAFATDLPPVVGSGEGWVQILVALVENAVEAMPGGGLVEIGAAKDPEREGFVAVWVRDTGRGLPPEVLPHVLEPFYTSRAEAGAEGLGLSMVAALVEALGGEVRIDSRVGAGTRVDIEVPHVAQQRREEMRLEGDVLLADDDAAVRSSVARVLGSLGLTVAQTDSGAGARSRLLAEPARFRAAVLDVVMPGTPVGEVVAAARELRPDLPVLLISGYDTMHMVDAVLALGGVRFLRKPFTREEVFRALKDLMAGAT